MKSLRLKTISSFVSKEDKVVDIGCDHAYLSIYLLENDICQKVIATDINKNALENAEKNIKSRKLENQLKTFLSDGLKSVDDYDINTLIISGVGATTILHIVENIGKHPVKKLILQSNNDLPILRKELRKIGYYLQKEKVIFEKNHYYTIGVYTKKYRKLSLCEKQFGIYDASNTSYYASLYNELLTINKKITFRKKTKKKVEILIQLFLLKKYL